MTGRQYTRVHPCCHILCTTLTPAEGRLTSNLCGAQVGVPGVFGDSSTTGLPLNETTVGTVYVGPYSNLRGPQHTVYVVNDLPRVQVADQLKKAGYKNAIMGS